MTGLVEEKELISPTTATTMTTTIPSLPTLNHYRLDRNSNLPNWKKKLRECCYRRVREDRTRLLWKMRLPADRTCTEKEFTKSAFQDIVSDELKKIRDLSSSETKVTGSLSSNADDMIWEYNGLHTAYEGECEEILLEMQRIFYEDLMTEPLGGEHESFDLFEDEQDEYLARAAFEYMQLNDEKRHKQQTWCPICKKGELQENRHFISCNLCNFKINRSDEVNLELLRARLAEAHEEHTDRGCRSKPEFCIQTVFDLTALYIECKHCNTLEIVI